MKPHNSPLVIALAILGLTSFAQAANFTWNSTASPSGPVDGSGTWSTSVSGTNWWNGSTNVAWPNTNTSVAVLGTGGALASNQALNVSGTVVANGINFNTTGANFYQTIGGTIDLAGAAPTVNVASSGAGTLRSTIIGTSGFKKTGAGTLSIGSNATNADLSGLSGTIDLSAGSTFSTVDGASAAWNLSASGVQLGLNSSIGTHPDFHLGSLSGVAGSTLRVAGSTATATTAHVGSLNTTTTFSGNVTGVNFGIDKVGTGTMTLAGTGNTYTGATTVSAGTLLLNGNFTGSGNYSAAANAVLGGSGTITPGGAGAITISASGVLAPGDGLGTLTINSTSSSSTHILTLSSDATLKMDLNSTGPADFQSDSIALLNGSANDILFTNNVINFTDLSAGNLAAGQYLLFSADISGAYQGLTVGAGNVITAGLSIGSGLGAYAGSSLELVGNDIYLNVVPEPAQTLLIGVGLGFLLLVRGSKRRRGSVGAM